MARIWLMEGEWGLVNFSLQAVPHWEEGGTRMS
jgi:hypothetical protein